MKFRTLDRKAMETAKRLWKLKKHVHQIGFVCLIRMAFIDGDQNRR